MIRINVSTPADLMKTVFILIIWPFTLSHLSQQADIMQI